MLRVALLLQAGTASAGAADAMQAQVARAIDPCRRGPAGEITVCGRANAARSPYRLPVIAGQHDGFAIDGPVDSVSRSRHGLMDVGGAGSQANGCGATGVGGAYGCMARRWKEADEQAGFPGGVHFGPK